MADKIEQDVMRRLVGALRRMYPKGTRVELVKMEDVQAPPVGTHGTVTGVGLLKRQKQLNSPRN